jgi:hypothetical protein
MFELKINGKNGLSIKELNRHKDIIPLVKYYNEDFKRT